MRVAKLPLGLHPQGHVTKIQTREAASSRLSAEPIEGWEVLDAGRFDEEI